MYMNLPTEDVPRMLRFNRNMQICRDLKVGIAKDVSWDDDLADHLPLQLMDFHFAFRSQGHIAAEIKHSTITMLQGGLYTFVGPPSSGKGTLLNLIGDVYLAHIEGFSMNCSAAGSGNLVLPPHLRTIHVSYEPMFFEDTLLANLTFGCAKSSNDGNLERVLDICKKLHISENILLTIEANELATEWLTVLSATEASLLHIARALIANPDVLVIHKPTLYLSNEMADVVYTVLKDFVDNRGLLLDGEEFHTRRPRTCIVSARRALGAGALMADSVFHVSRIQGVYHVKAPKPEELLRPTEQQHRRTSLNLGCDSLASRL